MVESLLFGYRAGTRLNGYGPIWLDCDLRQEYVRFLMQTGVAGRDLIAGFEGAEPSDLADCEEIVNALGLPLNPNQFDALVSAVEGIGPGVLEPDRSLGRALRNLDWTAAADALLLYDRDTGGRRSAALAGRRSAERELFLAPVGRFTRARSGISERSESLLRRIEQVRRVWSGPVGPSREPRR